MRDGRRTSIYTHSKHLAFVQISQRIPFCQTRSVSDYRRTLEIPESYFESRDVSDSDFNIGVCTAPDVDSYESGRRIGND